MLIQFSFNNVIGMTRPTDIAKVNTVAGMCWASSPRVVGLHAQSPSAHPDVVLVLGLPSKGSPVSKLDKSLGMLERLRGLGEKGWRKGLLTSMIH